MVLISYSFMIILISIVWILTRTIVCINQRYISLKRELQLILVYICIIVVARFTFFPFEQINGMIQPLVFDVNNAFPFKINLKPFVHLFDYPEMKSAILNFVGNITMFIPIGIVFPTVYKKINTHIKVISAGVGFSLIIELLQLPFYDRVSDIDDLILNSTGFIIGYGIYLLVKLIKNKIVYRKSDGK